MKTRRMFFSVISTAGGIYVLLCLVLYVAQDRLLFFPQPANAQVYSNWQTHEYYLDIGNRRLHGWSIKGQSGNNKAIIYFGGNAEDVVYNLYDANDYAVGRLFFTNYAGYGNSEGEPSQEALLNDALAVFDTLIDTYKLDSNQVYVMGRSLGSSVATYVASQRRVKGLILITPFDSVENVAAHYYSWFPVSLLLKHRFSTIDDIRHVECPILVLAAEQDEVIPRASLQNLYESARDKITLASIPYATHQNINAFESYFTYINRFIQGDTAAH